MGTNLVFDLCFEKLAAFVPHLNENWWHKAACGLVFMRVGGRGCMEDVFGAHGVMLVWV